MAQRKRVITADASRDLISELPVELKDRILECLPTRDAVKTALLSTGWNNTWLQHGRLMFDLNFFLGARIRKGSGLPYVKIIIYILLQRIRPVKKFSIDTNSLKIHDPKLKQSDLDQWFLFLSRNGVEELCISHGGHPYKLPFCIVLCPTIKQLRLSTLPLDFPINAPSIFPGVTSLVFCGVVFKHNVNGIVYSIHNLEKLDLSSCEGINNFKISTPKLESLSIMGSMFSVESRWLALRLKTIKVLCMEGSLLLWKDAEVASFPTAINLQVIKLHSLEIANGKHIIGVLQLLRKAPNLCELDIEPPYSDGIEDNDMEDDDKKAASRLLKDLDMKMLKTIKIKLFCGFTIKTFFVKMLLSKPPILERLVFMESYYYMKYGYTVINIVKEMLCFPRASPKAQIVINGKIYA